MNTLRALLIMFGYFDCGPHEIRELMRRAEMVHDAPPISLLLQLPDKITCETHRTNVANRICYINDYRCVYPDTYYSFEDELSQLNRIDSALACMIDAQRDGRFWPGYIRQIRLADLRAILGDEEFNEHFKIARGLQ